MDWLLPAGVAAAAIGLTYVFCIRPMRRGHCAMMPATDAEESERATEIARLRAEVAELRRQSAG